MDIGQRAASVRFLIRDRAGQFTGSFDAVFQAEGIRILASPPQAPRANAICERIIGTLRREVLDRLLIVNEHHLRQVLTEYLLHYNTVRPHRALGQFAPDQAHTQPPQVNLAEHRIRRKTSPQRTHQRIRDSCMTAPTVLREYAGHCHGRVIEPHRMGASSGVGSGSCVPGAKIPRFSSRRTWGRTLLSSEASRPLYLAAVVRELPSLWRSGTSVPRRR